VAHLEKSDGYANQILFIPQLGNVLFFQTRHGAFKRMGVQIVTVFEGSGRRGIKVNRARGRSEARLDGKFAVVLNVSPSGGAVSERH